MNKEWKYQISSSNETANGKIVETRVTKECDVSEVLEQIKKFIFTHDDVTYDNPLTIKGKKDGKEYTFKCGFVTDEF